jgi:hypothetical protein
MPSRIVDYSGTTSSLYLREPRQSLNLGKGGKVQKRSLKKTLIDLPQPFTFHVLLFTGLYCGSQR